MARAWSILVTITAVLIVATPDPYATAPVLLGEWVALGLYGFSVLALLAAWRWEVWGGAAAIAGVLGSYVAFAVARDLPVMLRTFVEQGPGVLPFLVLGLPGAVFIAMHLLQPVAAHEVMGGWVARLKFVARAWSVVSLGMLLLLYVNLPRELAAQGVTLGLGGWMASLVFPVAMGAGLVLAWWRTSLGGTLGLASVVLHHLASWLVLGEVPAWPFPVDLLIAIPSALFLYVALCEAGVRRASRRSGLAPSPRS